MKKGFTLAEVLITMTILGVIAALTVPSLQSNVNKTAMEKQTVKFYSQLQEAVKRYMAEEEIDTIVFTDFNPNQFTEKYFSFDRKCTNLSDCLPDKYYKIDNSRAFSDISTQFSDNHNYVLPDGTVFAISDNGGVTIDVNGKKKPNKVGYDMWLLKINTDGKVTGFVDTNNTRKSDCTGGDYQRCFSYFKNNGFRIDY